MKSARDFRNGPVPAGQPSKTTSGLRRAIRPVAPVREPADSDPTLEIVVSTAPSASDETAAVSKEWLDELRSAARRSEPPAALPAPRPFASLPLARASDDEVARDPYDAIEQPLRRVMSRPITFRPPSTLWATRLEAAPASRARLEAKPTPRGGLAVVIALGLLVLAAKAAFVWSLVAAFR